MGQIQGDLVLIQIEDPTAAGSFVTLGNQRGASISLSTEEADTTNKNSGGWHSGLPTIRSWSIEGSGQFDSGSSIQAFLEDMYFTRAQRNVRFITQTHRFDGLATLSELSIEAPHDNVAEMSFTLAGSGPLVRTAL